MLGVSQTAPDLSLQSLENGKTNVFETAKDQYSLLIFYKYNCGTCRFSFPFFQRMYDAFGDAMHFRAIAQDDSKTTAQFRKDLRVSIPTLLDLEPYNAGRAFGIHAVPSMFLIDPNRKIAFTSYGFVKQELLNLADILAEKTGRLQIDIFGNADVPEIKPG
jgi:cytochrome c biogenesis protein CcmG, thiol:disulfide interchange protein DsbE